MKIKHLFFTIMISLISMSTIAQETGNFTDPRDGKTYKTIKIGDQTWMAENLNYNTGEGCFSNDTLGMLYYSNTLNNLAPKGWHIPNHEEFETLMYYVEYEKKSGVEKLLTGGSTGFNAVCGGYAKMDSTSTMKQKGVITYFWTSNTYMEGYRIVFAVDCSKSHADIEYYGKPYEAYSIRCLKD